MGGNNPSGRGHVRSSYNQASAVAYANPYLGAAHQHCPTDGAGISYGNAHCPTDGAGISYGIAHCPTDGDGNAHFPTDHIATSLMQLVACLF